MKRIAEILAVCLVAVAALLGAECLTPQSVPDAAMPDDLPETCFVADDCATPAAMAPQSSFHFNTPAKTVHHTGMTMALRHSESARSSHCLTQRSHTLNITISFPTFRRDIPFRWFT